MRRFGDAGAMKMDNNNNNDKMNSSTTQEESCNYGSSSAATPKHKYKNGDSSSQGINGNDKPSNNKNACSSSTIEVDGNTDDSSSLAYTSDTAMESDYFFSSEEYATNEMDSDQSDAAAAANFENGKYSSATCNGASLTSSSAQGTSYAPDAGTHTGDQEQTEMRASNRVQYVPDPLFKQQDEVLKQAPPTSASTSSNGYTTCSSSFESGVLLHGVEEADAGAVGFHPKSATNDCCDVLDEPPRNDTQQKQQHRPSKEEHSYSLPSKMQQQHKKQDPCCTTIGTASSPCASSGTLQSFTEAHQPCGSIPSVKIGDDDDDDDDESGYSSYDERSWHGTQDPFCNSRTNTIALPNKDIASKGGQAQHSHMKGLHPIGTQRKQAPPISNGDNSKDNQYASTNADAENNKKKPPGDVLMNGSSGKKKKRAALLDTFRAYKSTGSLFHTDSKTTTAATGDVLHGDDDMAPTTRNEKRGATSLRDFHKSLKCQQRDASVSAGSASSSSFRETDTSVVAAAKMSATHDTSTAEGWTYDDRVARKKREIMQKAKARSRMQGVATMEGQATAAQSESPSVRGYATFRRDYGGNDTESWAPPPGEELAMRDPAARSQSERTGRGVSGDHDFAAAAIHDPSARSQSERLMSRAPGDELAAAAMLNGGKLRNAPGDDLAKQMRSTAKQADVTDFCEYPDEKEKWKNESDEVAGNDEKMGVARSLSIDSVDEDEPRPGAYPVRGRAFGTFPEWGRHRHQENRIASNEVGLVDPDALMENGEVDPELMQVTATILDEDEIEDKVRQEMILNAVQGEVVEPISEQNKFKRTYIAACVVVALAFIGVVVGLAVGLTNTESTATPSPSRTDPPLTLSPTPNPTATPIPTLESIKKNGTLNCGVGDFRGFYEFDNETGVGVGFQFDLCRAVAAAIFGDNNTDRVNAVVTKSSERFIALADKTIDLLARSPTHTMERDVYLESTGTGFSFATPYLYDGLGFAGTPPYGACADNLSSYAGDCRLLQVCVTNESSHVPVVQRLLPEPVIFLCDDVRDGFMAESCNAMAGEKFMLAKHQLRSRGYNGTYEIGTNVYSKEPLAMVTRDDDMQWSDFVNLIMHALLAAEAQGVTQATATDLSTTTVFEEFESMFINAVAAVGNYGEIYERHLEQIVPRENVNRINTDGKTGLLLSNPFGQVDIAGPGPTEDSTLANITLRGHLRCGVTPRAGFAKFDLDKKAWVGLDADFCYAIASSVFNRKTNVIFENLTATETFSSLATGNIDVLAGASSNVLSEVREPSSGQGFSFSQPYFYDPPSGVADNVVMTRALATRQDDAQWSSFVYWIVASFFHAEETYVMQSTFEKMPTVNLFGPAYVGMFQDAIFSVGNYKEMYERNLEQLIPRSGRNQLNRNLVGPQHFPLLGI